MPITVSRFVCVVCVAVRNSRQRARKWGAARMQVPSLNTLPYTNLFKHSPVHKHPMSYTLCLSPCLSYVLSFKFSHTLARISSFPPSHYQPPPLPPRFFHSNVEGGGKGGVVGWEVRSLLDGPCIDDIPMIILSTRQHHPPLRCVLLS